MELPEDEEERKKEKKIKEEEKTKISTKLWEDILEIKVEKVVISDLLVTSQAVCHNHIGMDSKHERGQISGELRGSNDTCGCTLTAPFLKSRRWRLTRMTHL